MLFAVSTVSYSQDESDNQFERDNQQKKKSALMDRIRFGGGAGAQFGAQTYIQATPQITYYITDRLTSGLGITYIYYRYDLDRIYGSGGIYTSSVYGGSAHVNYLLLKSALIHTEYEALNYEYYDRITYNFERRWLGSFFVGGGYRQYFNNDRSYIQILLLYNLNYQPNSLYSSPFVPRINIYF